MNQPKALLINHIAVRGASSFIACMHDRFCNILLRLQTNIQCPSPQCVLDFTWTIQIFVAWFDILFAVTDSDCLTNNRRCFRCLIGTLSTSLIEFIFIEFLSRALLFYSILSHIAL
jgi:hypothetical protein